jgi:hypothetical protein
VEEQIRSLSAEELRELRSWFAEYDAERWDAQLDADVKAGKLDRLADEGLRDHQAGRSSKL